MAKFKTLFAVFLIGSLWQLPAAAHHSHGNYDIDVYTHLEGTVREVLLINPHTWIHLEVEDENGEPQLWALEGGTVAEITATGWTRDSVLPGDTISVRCHQLRDRSLGCLLGFVKTQDGEEMEWN